MRIRFWGVRGSHPTPLSPEILREKISTVVQRIQEKDLQSPASRELFLASLPDWLYGTPGGNTSCIEVRLSDGTCLIMDAGTGIIPLSKSYLHAKRPPGTYHIFFSHFHYDHIQGLPFLSQAYHPSLSVHFYSPVRDLEFILRDHMQHPYFPVGMDKMTPNLNFHCLDQTPTIKIGNATISWLSLNHPGGAYAYKVTEGNHSFIYATDVELSERDFDESGTKKHFFANTDMVVMDTMYTLGEAIEKFNWGHSSFSLGVEFAMACKVKDFYLFHHEPNYSDKLLYANLRAARWYAQRHKNPIQIHLAEEGHSITVGEPVSI
jgi:phosphoribosyl 1,2-cyclic phosphodiesterase